AVVDALYIPAVRSVENPPCGPVTRERTAGTPSTVIPRIVTDAPATGRPEVASTTTPWTAPLGGSSWRAWTTGAPATTASKLTGAYWMGLAAGSLSISSWVPFTSGKVTSPDGSVTPRTVSPSETAAPARGDPDRPSVILPEN